MAPFPVSIERRKLTPFSYTLHPWVIKSLSSIPQPPIIISILLIACSFFSKPLQPFLNSPPIPFTIYNEQNGKHYQTSIFQLYRTQLLYARSYCTAHCSCITHYSRTTHCSRTEHCSCIRRCCTKCCYFTAWCYCAACYPCITC